MSRRARPEFTSGKGSGVILNVHRTPVSGVKGGAHYASAKAALQRCTTITAAEWGRYGIRVNCMLGAIASERVVQAWEVAGIDQADFAANIPLGRAGRPDEVAGRSCSWSAMPPRTSGPDIRRRRRASLGGIPDS